MPNPNNWRRKMSLLTTFVTLLLAIMFLLMGFIMNICDSRGRNGGIPGIGDEEFTTSGSSGVGSGGKRSYRSLIPSSMSQIPDNQIIMTPIRSTTSFNDLASSSRGTSNSRASRNVNSSIGINKNHPKTSKGCFNTSIVTNLVYESKLVFAAKILNITEIIVNKPLENSKTEHPISNNYYYYDFNRKRRRESSIRNGKSSWSRSTNSSLNSQTLRSTNKAPVNYTLSIARVQIKTIFKGSSDLEGLFLTLVIEPHDGSKESRTMSRCLRKLRSLDTRVFFYKFLPKGTKMKPFNGNDSIKLNNQTSVPLPPTLHVLAAVRSAVKDEQRIGKWTCGRTIKLSLEMSELPWVTV